MLQPKRTKFRKQHTGRNRGLAVSGSTVSFGDFGLKATGRGRLTARQIEAARRTISRHVKRGGKLFIRVFPDKPITKKPLEVRMGKGKGNVEYWVALVQPGRMLYEIEGVTEDAMCEVQGLPAKTLISEYAPGQMEIVLRHRADVLKACDEGIMLKRLIKACAEKHGLAATFMAKPYAEWTGSGMHVHVSLGDDQGHNLFAAEDPQKNALLMQAIGGLKAAMAESMLIFAPNANSYRRFRRNSYAPVSASWGINNRTVSLRIPAGAANACHIEHRPSGADANPYLVMAAILAGMHHGITEKADPGNPVTGNGYEKRAKYIPGNWFDAIDAFWRASILKEYFGKDFVDTYCTLKEVEADRFYAEPTTRDFEWYLRTV